MKGQVGKKKAGPRKEIMLKVEGEPVRMVE